MGAATGPPPEQIRVFSLRKGFGGSQSALVLLPVGPARELFNSGRLRVGMISCRVRMADQKLKQKLDGPAVTPANDG